MDGGGSRARARSNSYCRTSYWSASRSSVRARDVWRSTRRAVHKRSISSAACLARSNVDPVAVLELPVISEDMLQALAGRRWAGRNEQL